MLNEKEKKEIFEDTISDKRRKSFEKADKIAEEFVQKYRNSLTVDKVIQFLMSVQEVIGPFPISKEVPTQPCKFRL